jgi:hypothetical protein
MVAGASGAGGRALVVAGGVGDALFVGVVGGGEPAAVWITQRGRGVADAFAAGAIALAGAADRPARAAVGAAWAVERARAGRGRGAVRHAHRRALTDARDRSTSAEIEERWTVCVARARRVLAPLPPVRRHRLRARRAVRGRPHDRIGLRDRWGEPHHEGPDDDGAHAASVSALRGWSSTSPRMRPAGSRGAASTRTSRSCAHAMIAGRSSGTRAKHTSIVGRRDDSDGRLRHTMAAHLGHGRRDDSDELRRVAARTTGIARRAPPLGPAGRFARSMRRTTRSQRSRRAMREDARRPEHGRRMLCARDAEGHARGRVKRASTAVERAAHATRKAVHAVA